MSSSQISNPDMEIASDARNYAKTGNIEGLYSLIHKDPHAFSQFLQDTDKLHFVTTPLHVAAAEGQTRFAVEMLNLMPSLGTKLDPDGLSPLHVALKGGKTETARAMVQVDKQLVRVKGRDRSNPLLYSIRVNAGLEVLAGFLMDCPDAIEDLNSRFQNAVHVAIEEENCDAAVLLMNWLVRREKEEVLGWRDEHGNTALHCAVQCDNFVQGVKIMVGRAKLNKRNSNGDTALDIAERLENTEIVKVLKKAKARRSNKLPEKQTLSEYFMSHDTICENFVRQYYFMVKDLTNDMRSVILVVAALIATATYQAILQPPGGVYQGEADDNKSTTTGRLAVKNLPGKMVMGDPDYSQFMPANTVAFTLSIVMIIFVLHGRPYNLILHACLIFLAHSYLIAMAFVSGSDGLSDSMFFMAWFVIGFAFFAKLLYYVVKAVLVENVWWLPRCGVMSSNLSYRLGQWKNTISRARNLRRQYKLIQR